MPTIYLRSTTGNDSNDGSTWALAKATLAAAITAAGNGGTVYVSQAHAGTQGTTITLTAPNSPANRVRIICVNDGAEPPTTLATTATVTMTGVTSGDIISLVGYAYVYGVKFISDGQISMNSTASDNGWEIESGELYLRHNTASTRWLNIGASSTRCYTLKLKNSVLRYSRVERACGVFTGHVIFENVTFACDVTYTGPLFLLADGSSARSYTLLLNDCDLSASTGKLMQCPSINGTVRLINCRVAPGVTINGSTVTQQGPIIELVACDDSTGNKLYRAHRQTFAGEVSVSDAVYRTGGLTYDTTPISYKLASSSAMSAYLDGVESFPYEGYVAAGTKTFTLDLIHDSATALNDDDFTVELEYLGAAGSVQHSSVSSARPLLASPTPIPSSTATWTHSMTNPNRQKVTLTVAVARAGLYRLRAKLTKPSYTVYIDEPVIT